MLDFQGLLKYRLLTLQRKIDRINLNDRLTLATKVELLEHIVDFELVDLIALVRLGEPGRMN